MSTTPAGTDDASAHALAGMTPMQFRDAGARVLDAIAAYWERLERDASSVPVLSRVKPREVFDALPVHPPQEPDPAWLSAHLRDLERVVMPGLTHWQHPHFYAFFPANASFPAILGELLCAGLGVQGMLWATSPACTEVEQRVLDWLAEAIGLPESFRGTVPVADTGAGLTRGGGVIQGTASEATLAAILAGRGRAIGAWQKTGISRREGAGRCVVYASVQAHSSVVKGAMVAGLAFAPDDRERVRLIRTDAAHRMDAGALEEALRRDRAQGLIPCAVVATVGTTGCTAIDPVQEIAGAIARACSGLPALPWLHVDAAHAGAACVCPEFQHWLRGVDEADSVCMNPHKWLLTNFDCDCFWTRDRAALTGALSITPEYLRNAASEAGDVVDYRDWHVPLGRRFRAMKLWMVFRAFGVSGMRAFVREHVRLAAWLEGELIRSGKFELAAERTMNLVCVRCRRGAGESAAQADARSRALLEQINASGRAYLTHTTLPEPGAEAPGGRFVTRVCIGGTLTREEHVRELAGWMISGA